MQLFYEENIESTSLQLSDENCRHIIQALRMQVNDTFLLTDGKNKKCIATIQEINKKKCTVFLSQKEVVATTQPQVNLAIAFTKNANRMEWLLEKITEIGVANIYPLQTKRTEQLYPKKDRLQHILISAMCQSKQYQLPVLHDLINLEKLLNQNKSEQNFIAHCIDDAAKLCLQQIAQPNKSSLILIGPEGDFTQDEVSLCLAHQCTAVSLGHTRLRTETAGLVGVTLLNNLS
jgi:16S rRNA (uracil1498-N3)-methyltransferase